MTVDADRQYLYGLSFHHERPYDIANMNPEYVVRLAAALRQAHAEGINATVFSGSREPSDHPSRYDLEGNSSHEYGLAADIGGIGTAGSSTALRWAEIAKANGLSSPYNPSGVEYNHWQLPALPLEQTPQLLAALKTAKATGNLNTMWAAYQANERAPASPGHPGTGVDPYQAYYDAVARAESGNQNIANKGGSSAYGYWQITQPTFQALAASHPELGLTDRTNPDQQRKAMVALTNDNAKLLSGAGIPINNNNLYMAHFLGGEGGVKFLTALKADPNASFASIFPKEAAANPGVAGGSLQQVFDRMSARLGAPGAPAAGGAGGGAAPAPGAAPAAPSMQASIGQMLGQAFSNLGNTDSTGLHFTAPPDQPAIRSMALGEDFTPPHEAVPASLAGGVGSSPLAQQLGQLAAQPSDPTLVNPNVVPSITAGAPSMSSMIAAPGYTGGVTSLLGGKPNLMNPYSIPSRLT
jgi:hypothetical protein